MSFGEGNLREKLAALQAENDALREFAFDFLKWGQDGNMRCTVSCGDCPHDGDGGCEFHNRAEELLGTGDFRNPEVQEALSYIDGWSPRSVEWLLRQYEDDKLMRDCDCEMQVLLATKELKRTVAAKDVVLARLAEAVRSLGDEVDLEELEKAAEAELDETDGEVEE